MENIRQNLIAAGVKPNDKDVIDVKLLAIDPGSYQTGYALIRTGDAEILEYGDKIDNRQIRRRIMQRDYDILVIEILAHMGNKGGASLYETAYWIGRFREASRMKNCHLMYRREEYMHFFGTGSGNDSAIIATLKGRFGDKGTKKDPGWTYGLSGDAWQAFGIGVIAADKLNNRVHLED